MKISNKKSKETIATYVIRTWLATQRYTNVVSVMLRASEENLNTIKCYNSEEKLKLNILEQVREGFLLMLKKRDIKTVTFKRYSKITFIIIFKKLTIYNNNY